MKELLCPAGNFEKMKAAILYGADAVYLADRIRAELGVKEVVIDYVGPVIGAHAGPGVVALFFIGKER